MAPCGEVVFNNIILTVTSNNCRKNIEPHYLVENMGFINFTLNEEELRMRKIQICNNICLTTDCKIFYNRKEVIEIIVN